MHISTTKIAFSLDEIFNYLQSKDPLVWDKVSDLISEYADELYKNYPGTKLSTSPVTEGLRFKSIGVPIYFEIGSSSDPHIDSFAENSVLETPRSVALIRHSKSDRSAVCSV